MVEKNKIYECKITDLTVNGDGVTHIDGYPLFVKGALPGDELTIRPTKINKTYGFAQKAKLLSLSDKRRSPVCSSFPGCGGCSLLHYDYTGQLEFKSDFVKSNILRIGGCKEDEFVYEKIIAAQDEYYYRNKAQFPVRNENGRIMCGFYEPKSHRITNCEECHIQHKIINDAVKKTMDFIRENHLSAYNEEKHTGIIRHIYVRYSKENQNLMVVLVANTEKTIKNINRLVESLKPLGLKSLVQNVNTARTNVVLGEKNIVLWGEDHILMQVDDLVFKVSPLSFFQVNTEQMRKLYSKALEYAGLNGTETVFDLYCGVGSISLFMAKKANKVIGVEIVPSAIENAVENAELSGITNTRFYCGDCTEVVESLVRKGEKADVVVVDPPRKGCDEKLLELIKNISPKKLVYVSCNSATLARDISVLKEFGYSLKKACAVDLFPQTTHVESVALLMRTDSTTKFA